MKQSIHAFSIFIKSLIITIIYLIRTIFTRYFRDPSRANFNLLIHGWSDKLLNYADVSYTIHNPHHTEPKPGKATIMMVNHSSAYDIPLSFKVFPHHSIRMLAKKELSHIPLMGSGMRAAEFLFIDRKNRHQAIRDLEAARKLMESGIVMWIAPEGTRSRTGKMNPLKKGAFITAINAGAIIIPVGIRGAYDILAKDSHELKPHQHADIYIGEAIDAAQYTLEQKDELRAKVYEEMLLLTGQK